MKIFIKYVVVILSVTLLQSCDLDLQRSMDFDENDHWPELDALELSIHEYIIQESEFTLMAEAIQRAGMQSEFNEGNPPMERDSDTITVLLLRNEAMEEFLDDYGYDSVNEVPVTTLQNLLEYHVIRARVMQIDVRVQTNTSFQTLIDGPDGLIDIWTFRDFWRMHINTDPEFPDTAKSAVVFLHNFEFNNGVGHHLRNYVQRVPFE